MPANTGSLWADTAVLIKDSGMRTGLNAAVEEIIRKFVKNPKFEQEIRKQIGSSIDTSKLDREYDGLKDRLSQTTGGEKQDC